MKKNWELFASYVLVAVLSTIATLTLVYFMPIRQTKLDQLQELI